MASTSWQTVAVLVDPVRRSLYEHVRQQRHPVTREDAAAAVSISRSLTAFHLDKLVEAGLLRARYETPGDQPRGRGRAPKVYEPADQDLSLNLPPRQYELVGQILADAVAAQPNDARTAAVRRAREVGRQMPGHIGVSVPPGADSDAQAVALCEALTQIGYDPDVDRDGISLWNCPFHRLAAAQTELVCGLNESFIGGLLEGVPAPDFRARLAPKPDACCVHVDRREAPAVHR